MKRTIVITMVAGLAVAGCATERKAPTAAAPVPAAAPAAPASAKAAPTADKPAVKVGDTYEFAGNFVTVNCKRWEVKELNKDGFNISECGEYLSYISIDNGNLARIVTKSGDKVVQFSPTAQTLSFPLSTGKSWTGSYRGYTADDGSNWESNVSCQVKAFEPVKVAAGEMEAFRIECTDSWASGPFRGQATSTNWYAPKAKTVVKAMNSTSKFNMELASYSLK